MKWLWTYDNDRLNMIFGGITAAKTVKPWLVARVQSQ
jgi:hypothetical protein